MHNLRLIKAKSLAINWFHNFWTFSVVLKQSLIELLAKHTGKGDGSRFIIYLNLHNWLCLILFMKNMFVNHYNTFIEEWKWLVNECRILPFKLSITAFIIFVIFVSILLISFNNLILLRRIKLFSSCRTCYSHYKFWNKIYFKLYKINHFL